MYVNTVDVAFWPTQEEIAQWIKDDPPEYEDDPNRRKIISNGASYEEAVRSLIARASSADIEFSRGLMGDLVEEAQSQDERAGMHMDEVFVGLITGITH